MGDNADAQSIDSGASLDCSHFEQSDNWQASMRFLLLPLVRMGQATAQKMKAGLDAIRWCWCVYLSAAAAADDDGILYGPADFGNWTILSSSGAAIGTAVTTAGDLNLLDRSLAAAGGNDAATVQGTIDLSSS